MWRNFDQNWQQLCQLEKQRTTQAQNPGKGEICPREFTEKLIRKQRSKRASGFRMKFPLGLLTLFLALAQTSQHGRWNYRDGADRVNINGVRSVTRLLDHWGNRIFKHVKDTMISDPQTVLPDYSRIQPLSEALDDLFKEVRALKKRIADLTESLTGLETTFTQVGYGKPVKIKRVVMKRLPRKESAYQSQSRSLIRKPIRAPLRRRKPVNRGQATAASRRIEVCRIGGLCE
ncbi:uncharacterized protein [Scyliorhinus torazame]|uniref:uncharacterized protein n=1 Tax=Scyliorhinus torazame TaxID=75743 RepID=UPI003B5A85BA